MVLDGAAYARFLRSPPAYVCSETMELADGEHLAFLELRVQTVISLGRRQVTKNLVAPSTLGSLLNLYGAEACLFNACDSASTVSSNLSLAVCGRLQSFVLPPASPPILRRVLYCRPCLHLSIRLLHEQDGSETHHRGITTNDGGEWLGPRGP